MPDEQKVIYPTGAPIACPICAAMAIRNAPASPRKESDA